MGRRHCLPVVLAALALRRGLKQPADLLIRPEIAMLDVSTAIGGVQVAAAWSGLTTSVRTGDSAFVTAHGKSGWEWFGHRRHDRQTVDATGLVRHTLV